MLAATVPLIAWSKKNIVKSQKQKIASAPPEAEGESAGRECARGECVEQQCIRHGIDDGAQRVSRISSPSRSTMSTVRFVAI
jgi:hypothetical protein